MPQGKLKVKTKPPPNVKKSQKKGAPTTNRKNVPIKRKKQKFQEANKLKQTITKTVNKAAEDEIRAKAGKLNFTLSKAQQAVAKHNTGSSTSTEK